MSADVVIVGAGHAGVQLAVALATSPEAPSVCLLSDETVLPYERPPLTKRLLYGADDPEPVALRSADYWERSAVNLRTRCHVVDLDPSTRQVLTASGELIGYGTLVWATGGRAAACGLPGEHLAGVHTVRDFADLTELRTTVAGAARAVVVGGGYIGLEAAAALRMRGIGVTLVEVAPRLLARVTGTHVSSYLRDLHEREGVEVRVGVGVQSMRGSRGRVEAVILDDGTELPADVVVVGVGMRPRVEPLLLAGARGDSHGVEVDAACRTTLPGVHAVGDCVKQHSPWAVAGGPIRVESVHSAAQQAAAVAQHLAGREPVEPAPPRFWSTQYGEELRTVGLSSPADDVVLRGDPTTATFSVVYLREGRMVAIDTLNRPRDFARAQGLIAGRWVPSSAAELTAADLPRLPASSQVR